MRAIQLMGNVQPKRMSVVRHFGFRHCVAENSPWDRLKIISGMWWSLSREIKNLKKRKDFCNDDDFYLELLDGLKLVEHQFESDAMRCGLNPPRASLWVEGLVRQNHMWKWPNEILGRFCIVARPPELEIVKEILLSMILGEQK